MLAKILKWLTGIQWDQTRLFDASSAHIGWAGFGTLGFCLLEHMPFLQVWLGFLVWALVKEYVIDLTIEKGETLISSSVDAVTYQLGVILAGLSMLNVWLGLVASASLLFIMGVADHYGFFKSIEAFGDDD